MRIAGVPATARRLFASLFLVLCSIVASTSAAHAISASCTALKGQTFSFTGDGVFDETLNGGAIYTLEAGEKITFHVTVPAGSVVRISFAGESVTLFAEPTARSVTVTITVPNTGPTSSGVISFQGVISVPGGGVATVSAGIDCTGTATPDPDPEPDPEPEPDGNAAQKAGVVDNAMRGVVPGANLLGDFGVPDFGFNGLGIPNIPCGLLIASLNEDLRRALAEIAALDGNLRDVLTDRDDRNRMTRLGRLMKENVAELAPCLERFGGANAVGAALGGSGDNCSAEHGTVLLAQMRLALDMGDHVIALAALQNAAARAADASRKFIIASGAFDDAERAATASARARTERRRLLNRLTRQDPLDRALLNQLRADGESERGFEAVAAAFAVVQDTQARVNVSQSLLNQAEAALAACQAQNGSGFFPVANNMTPAGAAAERLATAHAPAQMPGIPGALGYQPGMPVTMAASANRFAFAYDLASTRQSLKRAYGAADTPDGLLGDPRFNMWVNGSVTFHIDPTGLGQRGTTAAVAAGASYRLMPWLNAGVAARYAHSNRFGATGNATASAWSVAAFAQARIANQLLLETILAYSGVSANASFASGATGTAFGRSLAGQAKLSRSFALGGWNITPALGISVVNVQRDAFTASDGTAVAGSNSTQTTLTFGPSFGPKQGFVLGDGRVTVTPSFGVGLFANLGRFDPFIGTGGATISSDTFGASASTGLAFAFTGGASAAINAAYVGIGGTSQSVTVSANLRVPIGGR